MNKTAVVYFDKVFAYASFTVQIKRLYVHNVRTIGSTTQFTIEYNSYLLILLREQRKIEN